MTRERSGTTSIEDVGGDPLRAEAQKKPQLPPKQVADESVGFVPRWRRTAVQCLGVGLFYAIVLIVFAAKVPNFLSSSNAQAIVDASAVLGIVAIGQSYAIISGGFDVSVGGIVPLGAIVYGLLLVDGVPLVPAMILTILTGAFVGLLNGFVVVKLMINPLIATLAMLSIAGGAAYILSDGLTTALTMPNAGFWGDRSLLGINNGSWAFLILALIAAVVLKFSVYGRCVYTVGGNREAAQLAGLRVDTIDFSVYVLSGACSGFAGAIAASQLLAAAPNIGVDTGLNSIAAVVLGGAALVGGIGTISGTVLGVLLLTTIANGLGLLQVASFYQTVITGAVLLVAVGFSQLREFLYTSSFLTSKKPS